MKTRKRISAVLLAAIMVISGIPSMVFAANNTSEFNVQGSKTADPTKLKADRKTTVMLEMPSGEYQNKVDIVFVMDDSTSINNLDYDFSEPVSDLFEGIVENNPGIDLKVGVIKFKGFATDMLGNGLVKYSDSTKESIEAAIKNNEVPGRGSNDHCGLVMAEKLLSFDSEVGDDNKYVVLLTDGKSYMWNNENDEPVCNYSQFLKSAKIQSSGRPVLNQTSGSNNKESGSTYSSLPYDGDSVLVYNNGTMGTAAQTSAYYQWLYDSDNSELSSVTKYDFPAYYSRYYTDYTGEFQPEGEVEPLTPSNGTVIPNKYSFYRKYYKYTPSAGTVWENLNYYTVSPYKLAEDGTFDTSVKDPDFFLLHPDTLQKGVYTAGHYWKETLQKKYNTAVITPPANKVASGSGVHLAASFSVWLRENCDYGALVSEYDQVQTLFNNIDNNIRYMVGSGVVTDEITDDFDLDDSSATPFRMTYDGTSLSAASAGENKWNFGTANEDGIFPYVVEYDQSTKTIKWTINVPIENLKKITLSYDLILKEDSAPGTYDTNKSAVLDYTSSDGKYEGQYEFEKPQVEYNKYKVTYKYTGNIPSGAPAVPAEKEYAEGAAVSKAAAPSMKGYTFSGWKGEVSTMPGHDVEVTGSWTAVSANYTLTIQYVYSTGGKAAKTYTARLKANKSYGPIKSPTISGYTADRTSISGVMPDHDVTYKVVYTPTGGGNPPDDPDNPPVNPGGGGNPPNNPGGGGGPVVTPDDGQTAPPAIPDDPTPTTEPPATVIDDPEPPLAAGAWALINLISAILTALGAIVALFRKKEEEDEEEETENMYTEGEEDDEDDDRGKKMLTAKVAGALAGVAAPIVFLLTEDMRLPMVMIDKWTILMIVILAAQVVAAVFNKKASELEDDQETAEEPAN